MAEFKKVAKEFGRMCWNSCGCSECPIGEASDRLGLSCSSFMYKYTEETEELVMKWSEAHPIMTNGKKFEEVFGISGRDIVAINKLAWLEEEYKGG